MSTSLVIHGYILFLATDLRNVSSYMTYSFYLGFHYKGDVFYLQSIVQGAEEVANCLGGRGCLL